MVVKIPENPLNCGSQNGKAKSPRARVIAPAAPNRSRNKRLPMDSQPNDMLEGLRSPGMAEATKALYPNGAKGTERAEVLRGVFFRLKRRDSHDNLTR